MHPVAFGWIIDGASIIQKRAPCGLSGLFICFHIANEPDLVRGMARALARGIQDTIANPEEAYTTSLNFVENLKDQDKDVQMQVLNTSIEFWQAERIGFSEPQAWENMNELLVKMALIPEPIDLSKAFTNEFIP